MMRPLQLATVLSLCALAAPCALAVPADTPLDISKAVNMGFRDEAPGDGKGGWSDQGPENDFAEFDFKRKSYSGVDFSIIDPARNGGKAVMTFDSPRARTSLRECEIQAPPEAKGRYLYLLHTMCWGAPKGTPIGFLEVTFKGGSAVQKIVRAGSEVANWWNPGDLPNGRVVAKKQNKSAEVGVFLSKLELDREPREIQSIKFQGAGEAVWIVLGATLSCKDIVIEDAHIVYKPDADWKVVDMSDIQVKAGSALDLSPFLEPGPAGKHGRAIIGKGGFLAFEDSPDVPRRMLGFNGLWSTMFGGEFENAPEKVAKYAELVRRQGFDIVRPLCFEGYLMRGAESDGVPNPVKLEAADRLIAELKKQGVYTWLTLGAYTVGFKKGYPLSKSGELMAMMYVGDKAVRANWKAMAEAMLSHVNPYTGLAWKDDPAIACVEFYNEQELGFIACASERIAPIATPAWRAWLEKRYGTPEKLSAAWKTTVKDFASLSIPGSLYASSPMNNDYGIFWRELQIEEAAWCEEIVRAAGYKGLVSQNNSSKNLNEVAARQVFSPVADMHGYFAHPSGFSRPGSRCNQSSAVGQAASAWRQTNATRIAGRPFFVTEHNQAFWNRYQHEHGLIFGAYSALQGFSELTVHEDAVALEAKRINCDFSVAVSPIGRANELLISCLFRRGDVKESGHLVELQVRDEFLDKDCNGVRAVSSDQSKIGLMTGFALAFPDLKPHWQVPKSSLKPDLSISPAGGATSKSDGWFVEVDESKKGASTLDAFVDVLKSKGILPKDNISVPSSEVFQSDTGEIVMKAKERLLKVATPRTEGATLEAGKGVEIDKLKIEGSSVDACVSVCSMDGKPLADSARMVLVYSTLIVNSGMELSSDRSTLFELGKNPPLMRVGKLDATLENSNGAKMALYALGLDGSRKERLPLKLEGGELKISLDSGVLKNGPTPFFELVAE